MGFLKRLIDDIRLYCRFSCRRLGLPGYQVHQIYLPEQQLIYIPIPKNACTSIKHALHEIEFGRRFDADLPAFSDYREHHDYYKKRPAAFTSVSALREQTSSTRFALVRDPVRRLISCYRNRVVDLGDLTSSRSTLKRLDVPTEPDINTFFLHLEEYRRVNKSIEHHSRLQSAFLGGTLAYLDRVFTMGDIPELVAMLRTYKPGLKLRQRKTGGTKITLADLSRKALRHAIDFYSPDYELLNRYFSPQEIVKEHRKMKRGEF
ncbi:sulfotransferase family 2 domain-containing protein [Fodinibius sp.]|uniref:sulfotransferase family 2 domain-containing protein n=1 Tax=Fodinibius sp. TaxID=1872440 RepID=UPI003563E7AC